MQGRQFLILIVLENGGREWLSCFLAPFCRILKLLAMGVARHRYPSPGISPPDALISAKENTKAPTVIVFIMDREINAMPIAPPGFSNQNIPRFLNKIIALMFSRCYTRKETEERLKMPPCFPLKIYQKQPNTQRRRRKVGSERAESNG